MRFSLAKALAVLCCTVMSSGAALAQDVIKIGVVGPNTGPFAVAGQSYRHGIDAFMAQKGNTVGGRKVEMVYRDSAGADPTLAKRLAEELIVNDKVSMLMG